VQQTPASGDAKRKQLAALIMARRESDVRAAVNGARLRGHLEPLSSDDPLTGFQAEEALAAIERDVARLPEVAVDQLIEKFTPPGFVW